MSKGKVIKNQAYIAQKREAEQIGGLSKLILIDEGIQIDEKPKSK